MSESEPLGREKAIDILLKEYDTLRSEIIHRVGQRVSFLGLFGAAIGYFLFKYESLGILQAIAIIGGIIFLALVWIQLGIVVGRCAARITSIEKQINALAGQKLLLWESSNQRTLFNRINLWFWWSRQEDFACQPDAAADAKKSR
jgi:hypothetical protein